MSIPNSPTTFEGQITVAIVVAIMFIIFFKIIGLRYAVTLGISAGILNLIPYLGSFLAMLPALVLGLVAGPEMFIKVLIVFAVEQTIEGRFVSPLVLGKPVKYPSDYHFVCALDVQDLCLEFGEFSLEFQSMHLLRW